VWHPRACRPAEEAGTWVAQDTAAVRTPSAAITYPGLGRRGGPGPQHYRARFAAAAPSGRAGCWALAGHMRTELVTDALAMAIERRRPAKGQTVVHSDRGSQYTSREFRDLALANGIIPSVGRTGICYDNAMAESFNETIKKELIHLRTWPTLGKVKSAVFEYIEAYYNRKRPHTRIGNLSPCEFELTFPVQLDEGMSEAA
jgi:transposase InsO family protein